MYTHEIYVCMHVHANMYIDVCIYKYIIHKFRKTKLFSFLISLHTTIKGRKKEQSQIYK